jgi:hypothetical protein
LSRLVSLSAPVHLNAAAEVAAVVLGGAIMRSPQTHTACLEPLTRHSRSIPGLTPGSARNVAAEIVRHVPTLNAAGKARIGLLVRAEAWTEAALALVEIEQPQWKPRRLVYEDGVWLCSLSQQPDLPIAFDDLAEGCHEVLPLAILRALDEARRHTACSAAIELPNDSHHLNGTPICCDNFS